MKMFVASRPVQEMLLLEGDLSTDVDALNPSITGFDLQGTPFTFDGPEGPPKSASQPLVLPKSSFWGAADGPSWLAKPWWHLVGRPGAGAATGYGDAIKTLFFSASQMRVVQATPCFS